MQNCQSQNEITLNYKLPIGLRLLIGAIGAMIVFFAGRDFIKAFGNFSISALFVGTITGTGVLMGGSALIAAIFALDTQWKIRRKSIEITATRGNHSRISNLYLENIRNSNILEIDTDSGTDFAIEMFDKDGKRHVSPKFEDRESAQFALDLFIGAG